MGLIKLENYLGLGEKKRTELISLGDPGHRTRSASFEIVMSPSGIIVVDLNCHSSNVKSRCTTFP